MGPPSPMFFFFNEKYPLPLGDPEREDLSIENILRAIRLGSVLIYKHQLLHLEGKLPPDPIAPADVPGTPPGSILSMIKTTHHMALYLYYLARDETYLLQVSSSCSSTTSSSKKILASSVSFIWLLFLLIQRPYRSTRSSCFWKPELILTRTTSTATPPSFIGLKL